MKILRTPLFVSGTLLAASHGLKAADLPVAKAAPVDYVRICDFAGSGFFYIPGTDTCLQISGVLRVEGGYDNTGRAVFAVPGAAGRAASAYQTTIPGASRDQSGFYARTRLGIDTRTQTAYGTLRAYFQYQIDRTQGLYAGGGATGTAASFENQGANNATLRRGFIQFAGITAGRVQSFFDFYADNYNYEGIANSDLNQNVFAYTYNAPAGLSATISIEDRNTRNLAQGLGTVLGGVNTVASAVNYGGETVPDIVGVLRLDQAWGSAQLSAAYHQIQSTSGSTTATAGYNSAEANGFAVQGGVHLKLPMLAAGDDLWLEGAYEQGAYSYIDSSSYMNGGFDNLAVGGFQHIDRDAVGIHLAGTAAGSYTLDMGHGYSVMAAFNHYFTPNFHDVVFGSFEHTSYGKGLRNIDWTEGGIGDVREFRVGNQFLWDPVKNLEFGLEFDYLKINQTLAHNVNQTATVLPTGTSLNPNAFEVRLRAERDF